MEGTAALCEGVKGWLLWKLLKLLSELLKLFNRVTM